MARAFTPSIAAINNTYYADYAGLCVEFPLNAQDFAGGYGGSTWVNGPDETDCFIFAYSFGLHTIHGTETLINVGFQKTTSHSFNEFYEKVADLTGTGTPTTSIGAGEQLYTAQIWSSFPTGTTVEQKSLQASSTVGCILKPELTYYYAPEWTEGQQVYTDPWFDVKYESETAIYLHEGGGLGRPYYIVTTAGKLDGSGVCI